MQTIGGYAFAGTRIEELTIPNSVKAIDSGSWTNGKNGSFENCTYLTKVTIGSNVEAIGNETFQNCTALTTVVIGERVKSIGANAFSGCTLLTEVINNGSNVEIDSTAFQGTPLEGTIS